MLNKLAEETGRALLDSGHVLAAAESCTGGWVAKLITDVAGSSAWFDRGFVTYTNLAKEEMLGVEHSTLENFGAVSEQTVAEMVAGALAHSNASVALSISGVAGPGGGSADKPVGMVCFGWKIVGQDSQVSTQYFSGDRDSVRKQAVEFSLQKLMEMLSH